MFLVSGYWDPKADVNRSALSVAKTIWRGELSIVRAGKFIPYRKRMKEGHKADLAVQRYVVSLLTTSVATLTTSGRFVEVFKQRRKARKLVPRTILH